jgi:hypothetical protein
MAWSTLFNARNIVQGMKSGRGECLWEGGSAHSSSKGYLEKDVEQSLQTWIELPA